MMTQPKKELSKYNQPRFEVTAPASIIIAPNSPHPTYYPPDLPGGSHSTPPSYAYPTPWKGKIYQPRAPPWVKNHTPPFKPWKGEIKSVPHAGNWKRKGDRVLYFIFFGLPLGLIVYSSSSFFTILAIHFGSPGEVIKAVRYFFSFAFLFFPSALICGSNIISANQ